jgi:hypothetical protein
MYDALFHVASLAVGYTVPALVMQRHISMPTIRIAAVFFALLRGCTEHALPLLVALGQAASPSIHRLAGVLEERSQLVMFASLLSATPFFTARLTEVLGRLPAAVFCGAFLLGGQTGAILLHDPPRQGDVRALHAAWRGEEAGIAKLAHLLEHVFVLAAVLVASNKVAAVLDEGRQLKRE